MLVFDVTDQVRETIQQTLYTLLRERDERLPLTPGRGRLRSSSGVGGRRSRVSGRAADTAERVATTVPTTGPTTGTSLTRVGTSPVSSLVTSSTVPSVTAS